MAAAAPAVHTVAPERQPSTTDGDRRVADAPSEDVWSTVERVRHAAAHGLPGGRTPPPDESNTRAVLNLQRTAGNRAVTMLFREAADTARQAAAAVGIEKVVDGPPSDVVDEFLASRRQLWKVKLVGLQVQASVSRSHKWTARYTDRALSENAVGAVMAQMFSSGDTNSAEKVRQAWAASIGSTVKYQPEIDPTAKRKPDAARGPEHLTILTDAAMRSLATALKLPPNYMHDRWQAKFGQARMIEFALRSCWTSFDQLVPAFRAEDLKRHQITVEAIRHLLDKWPDQMIEVAKKHPAAAPWRDAYKRRRDASRRNRDFDPNWEEREPKLEDFDPAPLSTWASTLLKLAVETRRVRRVHIKRDWDRDMKAGRNEYLRPHLIETDNAGRFALEQFEPTREVVLQPIGWTIRGGMTLTNIKEQQIFLLRVETSRVIFQNLVDTKFYEQTVDGFAQEQMYGIYAAAGRKAFGAIALSKWVIGLLGAVLPPVRYGLMATDVLNGAFKFQEHRAELEASYASFKLAYANIDSLVPGVIPKIRSAVLDKDALMILNPVAHPDVGAWVKVILRLVMERQARQVNASYLADAVEGFFNKAWAAVKKALGVLWEVVKHIVILEPAVSGSTGFSGSRAIGFAERKIAELGVMEAAKIVGQIRGLPDGDRERLAREIQDLLESGSTLIATVKKCMQW